ncbi:MAG: FAD-dependent oxidoreductase [Thermoanaerobaculia bacterium]
MSNRRADRPPRNQARGRVPSYRSCGGSYLNGYASLYDITPDWQPILDALPGVDNLYCAVGCSGHGFKLAPVVGEMMADLIVDGKGPEDDIQMFAFERFTSGKLVGGRYAHKILA